jgi:2-succinyl-5-enolpyruvyl-6-hydroxy-3-cyclohexene-1-carboxylate synthase
MTASDTWPNPSTAMAATVIDEMFRNGVRDLVLAPGSRSSALALAAADSSLRIWVEIDERSAGFFALGLAKAAMRTGTNVGAAVLTTSGTAAANLYPAVIEADESATPLLLLTADRPSEVREAGANQTIDQIKLFGDRVRWFTGFPPPYDYQGEGAFWRSTVCRAYAEATGRRRPPPGPVHINLEFREPLVALSDDGRSRAAPYRSATAGRPDGKPWTEVPEPERAGVDIEVAGRFLVIAGSGAQPAQVAAAIEVGAVVIAEGHSGCRLPGTITTAHHLLSSKAFVESARPEKAVLLGRVGLSRNLSSFLASVDQVVASPSGWPDPDRRAAQVVSSVRFVAGAVDRTWVELWMTAEKTARSLIDTGLDRFDLPTEPRAARDTFAAVPDDGVLAVASSMPVRDVDWFAAARDNITVVSNRGASGIDGFVSTSLGAAATGAATVALTGDLSLLHDQAGLLVRPRPSAVIVVVNNAGGGIFSFLPQASLPQHFERLFGTPTGVDFAKLADSNDLRYRLINKADDLIPAIRTSLSESLSTGGGVQLLEIQTDRTENVALHHRITADVVDAIEALLQS